ncbi:DUF4124 domain-containing protein [Marinobacter sp. F3R08]|nr:DUF4124 domain-containing protein [Marinobacter sp. F3R08]
MSCCILPLAANAGVYKWVDANGQTHFGDRPPADAESSEVRIDPAPASFDAAARERVRRMMEFVEQQQSERTAQQAVDVLVEEDSRKRTDLCKKLQSREKYLASVSRLYDINEQGERVYVNEAENDRIREDFGATVQKACGDS